MAIAFFGVASSPADNSANAAAPVTLTPPGSMLDGDLVVVFADKRTAGLTLSVSDPGGQNWFTDTERSTTTLSSCSFWCRFNGSWRANPAFTRSGADSTTPFQAVMLVFRPTVSSPSTSWAVDVAEAYATYTAVGATKTVTGQTTVHDSTVTIAAWFATAAITWSNLVGSGWSQAGLGAQYRDTSGSGLTASFAYKIQTSHGATGNVSQDQSVATAGADHILTFYEFSDYPRPDVSPVASATNGTTGNLNTGSQTPVAGRVSFLSICQINEGGSGTSPNQPSTPSGAGITWHLLATVTVLEVATGFVTRLTVFYGSAIAPSTGAVTSTLGNQQAFTWHWEEITNLSLESPVGVSGTASADAVTSWSVSLAGIKARSGAAAWSGAGNPVAMDPRTGWTEIADLIDAGDNLDLEVQFIATGDSTASASVTSGTANPLVGIACELQVPTPDEVAWSDLGRQTWAPPPSVLAPRDTDDLVTPATPLGPDEDFWVNAVAPAAWALVASVPVLDPEEIAAGFLAGEPDEDFWGDLGRQTWPWVLIARVPALDPEEIAAGFLAGEPDEDFWWNQVAPVGWVLIAHVPFLDPEEIAAGSLSGEPDEDFWVNAVAPAGWILIARVPALDPEEVTITPSIGVDEEPWARLPALQVRAPVLVAWIIGGDGSAERPRPPPTPGTQKQRYPFWYPAFLNGRIFD